MSAKKVGLAKPKPPDLWRGLRAGRGCPHLCRWAKGSHVLWGSRRAVFTADAVRASGVGHSPHPHRDEGPERSHGSEAEAGTASEPSPPSTEPPACAHVCGAVCSGAAAAEPLASGTRAGSTPSTECASRTAPADLAATGGGRGPPTVAVPAATPPCIQASGARLEGAWLGVRSWRYGRELKQLLI